MFVKLDMPLGQGCAPPPRFPNARHAERGVRSAVAMHGKKISYVGVKAVGRLEVVATRFLAAGEAEEVSMSRIWQSPNQAPSAGFSIRAQPRTMTTATRSVAQIPSYLFMAGGCHTRAAVPDQQIQFCSSDREGCNLT